MLIEPNSKLVMIGDSITDAGRVQPVAEGLFDPLGRGYVTMVDALISAVYPERKIRVINVGTSGNQTRQLKERWQRDVIDLKPDYVSCMIGTNDVWRQFDLPRITEQHVGPEEYERNLTELIEWTLPAVRRMILMTPFYIEPLRQDAMRARMDEYGAIVKKLAEKYGCVLVDTQAPFDKMLQHMHSAALAWDRVHPNQVGHMVLARAFLNALGFEWTR